MVFAINPTADKTYDAFLVRTPFSVYFSRTLMLISSHLQAAAQGGTPSTYTAPATGSQTPGSQTSTNAPSASQTGNSALGISTHKLTSVLAALGLIAGLTL